MDGLLRLIPQPTIIAQPQPGAYDVETPDGSLRLHFSPLGCKAEKRNYGLIAMDYEQFFGRYSGEVTDATGGMHRIDNVFGALERMQARF